MIKGQQLHEERIWAIWVFIRNTDKTIHLETVYVSIHYHSRHKVHGEEKQHAQKKTPKVKIKAEAVSEKRGSAGPHNDQDYGLELKNHR